MSIPLTRNVNYPAYIMGFPGPGNLGFLPVCSVTFVEHACSFTVQALATACLARNL